MTVDAERKALHDLEGLVSRNPDKYAGITSAVITDADGRTTDYVAVVGTIGDIDPLAPFLHSRYPYNLCIVRADRSAAELEEVAAALRKLNYPWDIWIDAAIARVAVHVPIFDQPTAEAIRPYASSVSIRPLVRSR